MLERAKKIEILRRLISDPYGHYHQINIRLFCLEYGWKFPIWGRAKYQYDELNENGASGPSQYPEAAIERQTPELNLIQMGNQAELQAAMDKLPAPLLEVLMLCDVEEMKYKEIALVLEIPIGTVMSRVARARASVRRLLMTAYVPAREISR